MLDGKRSTLHTHPSLLSLRVALAFAERESPSRPPRIDSNERRALQLIARMQAEHKKVFPFVSTKDLADIDA